MITKSRLFDYFSSTNNGVVLMGDLLFRHWVPLTTSSITNEPSSLSRRLLCLIYIEGDGLRYRLRYMVSKPDGYIVLCRTCSHCKDLDWIPTPYVGPSVFTSSLWSRRSAPLRHSCWRVWARLHCAHSPSPLCCWTPPSRSRHPSSLACCKIPSQIPNSNYSSNVGK